MKYFLTILLLVCGTIFTSAQQNNIDYPKTIPTFQFVKIKGDGPFKSSDITKNKKTLIGLVSPECVHCNLALEHLNNNVNYLKDINLILVTAYEKDVFMNKLNAIAPKLNDLNSLEILQDTNYEFGELFKAVSIPTFYLYDKNGNLETVKRGSVQINEIFNYLK